MRTSLHIGGLVAVGFDPTGKYLLTISHSGRGLFSTATWERVARDPSLAYPESGMGVGIGPIEGKEIPIIEIDYATGVLRAVSPDGKIKLAYQEGVADVEVSDR